MINQNEKIIDNIILKTKKKQMTKEEYTYISSFLGDVNFLIFGTGYDSDLWRFVNKNGRTIFLENNPKWILNTEDTFLVEYTTKLTEAELLLTEYVNGNDTRLRMQLPDIVLKTAWDFIFVDSPEGWNDNTPGRMQSIYAAKLLALSDTQIFIHDCDRYVEDLYSKKMFKSELNSLTKLKHFKKD